MNVSLFLAIKSDDYIDIFKNYSEYFSMFSVLKDILRSLAWLILKGLIKLAGMMNTLVDSAFNFLNFMNSDSFSGLYNSLRPFIWTVFLFGLIYLAYCYIFAHERPKGTVTNLLIFVGTVVLLPYMMAQMTNMVTYAKDMFSGGVASEKYELLAPYITDLVYMDSIDFDEKKISEGKINGYTSDSYAYIEYMDINEVVDPSDYDLNTKDLFKNQLVSKVQSKGKNMVTELEVSKIKKSKFFFKDTTPYYYRYHVNFLIAMLYLVSIIIVIAFSTVKLIHLVYELSAEKILVPFIAAGDLTNGQKIRKALIGIVNGYITIVCVLFLQKMFVVSCEYINSVKWSESAAANGLTKALIIIAGALFIVDGPNFFEQIFGIDAGLKSVGQALQSAYYSSQMMSALKSGISNKATKIGSAAKSIPGGVKNGASTAANVASGILGAYQGMKDTGVLESQNEKVSGQMAKSEQADKPEQAVTSDTSRNMDVQSNMQKTVSKDSLPTPEEKTMSEGALNNLKQASIPENNQDILKDAVNNSGLDNGRLDNNQTAANDMRSVSDSGDNLIDWAKSNTKVGKTLTGNYEKGKTFGHAAGNTINKLSNKDNKVNDMLSKDSLKG